MPMLQTICATLIMLWAISAQAWYPYSEKYTAWQEDRPILLSGLHNAVPTDHMPERAERMKACGLNAVFWMKPHRGMHLFQAAHDVEMEWGAGARVSSNDFVEVMKIPGNAYIMTGDEPGTDEEVEEMAHFTEWVKHAYPDAIAFGNLSITKYDHDTYMELVKPDVFSFDHYPLQRNGETQDYYLYNLAWGRQTAMKYKVPYWMWLQSFGREEEKPSYAYRIPDEADMRFLVFTALAHGVNGIQFFHYYGFNNEGMITDTGVKNVARTEQPHIYENTLPTRSWYAVRDVAGEIQNLARALLNLRSIGEITYAGNPLIWDRDAPDYALNPDPPIRSKPFAGNEQLYRVTIREQHNLGVLVAFFDDEAGEEYFMVVNLQHGPEMSKFEGRRTVVLTLASSIESVERLNRLSGEVETLNTVPADDARRLTLRLEGGTGDLFKWSNGKPWALR